jgi:hypothetical protein
MFSAESPLRSRESTLAPSSSNEAARCHLAGACGQEELAVDVDLIHALLGPGAGEPKAEQPHKTELKHPFHGESSCLKLRMVFLLGVSVTVDLHSKVKGRYYP